VKRIVLDQGLDATAAMILRKQVWDVVHVGAIAMHDAEDSEILNYAARESRAVITLDQDFPRILALTGASRPSVVLIRQQGLRAAELAALSLRFGKNTNKCWIGDASSNSAPAEREFACCL